MEPARAAEPKKAEANKPEAKKEPRKRKFPFRKAAEIEADIAAKEEEVAGIEADMMLPETLRDGSKVKAISERFAAAKAGSPAHSRATVRTTITAMSRSAAHSARPRTAWRMRAAVAGWWAR